MSFDIYDKMKCCFTTSVNFIKEVNDCIPWRRIANVITTLALLYLSPKPAIIGILVGYIFSKAKGEQDRQLDKTMKSITEFIFKNPFLSIFLACIDPSYTLPCIHFYWSLNVGRNMREQTIREPKEWLNARVELTDYIISFLP